MKPKLYLISGLPGTGKTSVCLELKNRGYKAIDADRTLAVKNNAGWVWEIDKFESATNVVDSDFIFVCGSAKNRDDFMDRFEKIFILNVDDETMKYRLKNRTNNNFGKDPQVLARQIANNSGVKSYSEKRGRIVIDATNPLSDAVDQIIAIIEE